MPKGFAAQVRSPTRAITRFSLSWNVTCDCLELGLAMRLRSSRAGQPRRRGPAHCPPRRRRRCRGAGPDVEARLERAMGKRRIAGAEDRVAPEVERRASSSAWPDVDLGEHAEALGLEGLGDLGACLVERARHGRVDSERFMDASCRSDRDSPCVGLLLPLQASCGRRPYRPRPHVGRAPRGPLRGACRPPGREGSRRGRP